MDCIERDDGDPCDFCMSILDGEDDDFELFLGGM